MITQRVWRHASSVAAARSFVYSKCRYYYSERAVTAAVSAESSLGGEVPHQASNFERPSGNASGGWVAQSQWNQQGASGFQNSNLRGYGQTMDRLNGQYSSNVPYEYPQSQSSVQGNYRQKTYEAYPQSGVSPSHGSMHGNCSQDAYGTYTPGVAQSHSSVLGNPPNSIGQFEQRPGNSYAGNVGANQRSSGGYQQVSGDGQYKWNPGTGQYQPISYAREGQQSPMPHQHQQNLYNNQNRILNSQVPSSSNLQVAPVNASESCPYNGTLEELDHFCKEGKVKEAVQVLALLEKKLVRVDMHRYEQLMRACGEARVLQEAKAIHNHVIRSVAPLEVGIYNQIMEMYSKCGSMDDALAVFDKMPERNLTSWEIMITWLAKNGLGEDSIDLFYEFKKSGLKPSGHFFIGLFSACGLLGDVNEGMLHFRSMSKEYGIEPSMEHYVSVVEMLGSVGHLDEALEFIENMPLEPTVDVWEILMNMCRIHGHQELGDRCAELVELLDASRLNEQSRSGLLPVKPSDVAKEKEKKRLESQNLLEVRSRVHEYRAGDTSHPDSDKIYAQLRGLKAQMKEAGYLPETRFVLHDIDQESKEEALLSHSERLAVSYGLISSPARSTIRVIKNLRVCVDCHNALKIMSKIVGREFVMRDAKRFHHIKDGVCSCRDYW